MQKSKLKVIKVVSVFKRYCENVQVYSVPYTIWILIVLGFNDTSTLVGHFVSSPREREKRDRIVEEMKEGDSEERGTGMKGKKREK